MQLGSPNDTQIHDESWNHMYLGSKGQRSRSRVNRREYLHSYECWFLLVSLLFLPQFIVDKIICSSKPMHCQICMSRPCIQQLLWYEFCGCCDPSMQHFICLPFLCCFVTGPPNGPILFCLLASVGVVCNAAGRGARGRSGGRHCTAGQYVDVPLGRHLVIPGL